MSPSYISCWSYKFYIFGGFARPYNNIPLALQSSDSNVYWDLWTFSLEFAFKHNLADQLGRLVDLKGPEGRSLGHSAVTGFLLELKELKNCEPASFTLSTSEADLNKIDITDAFLCTAFSLLLSVYNDISEKLLVLRSENSAVFDEVEKAIVSLSSRHMNILHT